MKKKYYLLLCLLFASVAMGSSVYYAAHHNSKLVNTSKALSLNEVKVSENGFPSITKVVTETISKALFSAIYK